MMRYSIKINTLIIFASLILTLPLLSCRHKDLIYGSEQSKIVRVIFDWKDSPDANPASMSLYLYPADGGSPLRYEFSGREGGEIRVPYGTYDALCMNSDNTSWIHMTDSEEREECGLHVGKLTGGSAEGEFADVMQQCGVQTDGNLVTENPRDLWTGSSDGFEVLRNQSEQTLIIYPEYALCHYIVDIYDVKSIEKLQGHHVPAILSGMSEGIDALTRTQSTFHVSIPLILQTETRADGSLHAEFLTFGEDIPASPSHQIHVLTQLTDGSWKRNSTDVTDQIHLASDPRNVHIVIRGLEIPDVQSGGLSADVSEWESENITLRM